MITNILHKEEIATCLLDSISKDDRSVSWSKVIVDLQDTIINTYNKQIELRTFKGQWKNRISLVSKFLNIKLIDKFNDSWNNIENLIKKHDSNTTHLEKGSSSSSSSSSVLLKSSYFSINPLFPPPPASQISSQSSLRSSSSQSSSSSSSGNKHYILNEADLCNIKEKYNSINKSEMWRLSTGKYVEEEMLKLSLKSKYEHPCHSIIMDPTDKVWDDYFTKDELNEISTFNIKKLPALPNNIKDYINTYKGFDSNMDLLKHSLDHFSDPLKENDKSWIQELMNQISKLYIYNTLPLKNPSEAEFLHRVWSFIYKMFDASRINARFGELSSESTCNRKNSSFRSLASEESRPRKKMGDKIDIIFYTNDDDLEIGCAEVAKEVSILDDKYMDDILLKMPKTMKDMICSISSNTPNIHNQMIITGFALFGYNIQLLFMDIPAGKVCRYLKTPVFKFPISQQSFDRNIHPVIELVWKGKKMMEDMEELINNGSPSIVDYQTTANFTLPLSFTPSILKKNTKKRDINEVEG